MCFYVAFSVAVAMIISTATCPRTHRRRRWCVSHKLHWCMQWTAFFCVNRCEYFPGVYTLDSDTCRASENLIRLRGAMRVSRLWWSSWVTSSRPCPSLHGLGLEKDLSMCVVIFLEQTYTYYILEILRIGLNPRVVSHRVAWDRPNKAASQRT